MGWNFFDNLLFWLRRSILFIILIATVVAWWCLRPGISDAEGFLSLFGRSHAQPSPGDVAAIRVTMWTPIYAVAGSTQSGEIDFDFVPSGPTASRTITVELHSDSHLVDFEKTRIPVQISGTTPFDPVRFQVRNVRLLPGEIRIGAHLSDDLGHTSEIDPALVRVNGLARYIALGASIALGVFTVLGALASIIRGS